MFRAPRRSEIPEVLRQSVYPRLAKFLRLAQSFLLARYQRLAQSRRLGQVVRSTRIPRGKTPIFLGAGLALLGVGLATAVAGPAAPVANAGTAAIGRAETAGTVRTGGRPGGGGQPAAPQHQAPAGTGGGQAQPKPWGAVVRSIAAATNPKPSGGQLGPADLLHPAGFSGPQNALPMTAARWANARTIVQRALALKMGLRAAVIAIATAMQESTLLNLPYGDRDSLGLFQQRPSAGWGTPQQIMRPVYAADAFLHALRGYQANDPAWASQPLWQAAQGVQGSAFPYAYAQWEAQASGVVGTVATQLVH